MKKITLFMTALAVSIAAMAQDLQVNKLWEFSRTSTNLPTWFSGSSDDFRSIVVKDGKLYLMNRTKSRIVAINTEASDISAEVNNPTFITLSGYLAAPNNLSVTADGQMLGNSYAGATLKAAKIDLSTGATTQFLEKLPASGIGRFDYMNVYGDFSSSGSGYIVAPTCPSSGTGGNNIYIWDVTNGSINADVFTTLTRTTAFGSSSIALPIDANNFYAMSANTNPEVWNRDGTVTNFKSGIFPSQGTAAASGMAAFSLGTGENVKNYFIRTKGRFGGLEFYDVTNGVANATKLSTEVTDVFGSNANSTVITPIAVKKVNDYKIVIYQCAPNNGFAAYEVSLPTKTFTVTVPNGTEHVYIAGSFIGKFWDINDPFELTATGKPNEFSGTFPCEDDVEYKYLCEKGDWNYQEAVYQGSGDPIQHDNHTYAANDVVQIWYRVKSVTLNVSFEASVGVPNQLFLMSSINDWKEAIELTKQDGTFTTTLTNDTQKVPANTEYKYYTNEPNPAEQNWECNLDMTVSSNRWTIAPVMNDTIQRFTTRLVTETEVPALAPRLMRTPTGIRVELNEPANIELYNINGSLIEKTKATGTYTRDLNNGIYIIRINGKSTKFVK